MLIDVTLNLLLNILAFEHKRQFLQATEIPVSDFFITKGILRLIIFHFRGSLHSTLLLKRETMLRINGMVDGTWAR